MPRALCSLLLLACAGLATPRAWAALWPVAAEPREGTLLPRPLAPTRSAGEVRRMVREGRPEALAACAALLDSPTPAARALGLEGWRLAPTLPPSVRRQVERNLGDEDAGTRLLAVDVLAVHDLRPSWEVFAAKVDDPAREVRLRAIRALGATHEPKALLVLMGSRRDADRDVRAAALEAMGRTGDARAVVFLRPALDDQDPVLRRTAMQALASLGDTTVVPRLEAWAESLTPRGPSTAQNEGDRSAGATQARWQVSAARLALGQLATDESLSFLTRLLREPPWDPAVREGLRLAGVRAVPFLREEAAHGPPTSAVLALGLLAEVAPGTACHEADLELLARETAIALTALAGWKPCADDHLRRALASRFDDQVRAGSSSARSLSPAVRATLRQLLQSTP